jgi:hypothetical protein
MGKNSPYNITGNMISAEYPHANNDTIFETIIDEIERRERERLIIKKGKFNNESNAAAYLIEYENGERKWDGKRQ